MRRLARWLVRTTTRRTVLLALLLPAAWTAWALAPPSPEVRWSLPANDAANNWFLPDGRTVLTVKRVIKPLPYGGFGVSRPGPLIGRDIETGRERYRLLDFVKDVGLIETTPDGRRMTVQTDHGGLFVLDPIDGRQVAALPEANPSWTRFQEHINPVSPDGRWMAHSPQDNDVDLFDLAAGRDGPVLAGARRPMAFSPDGRVFAAETADQHIGFWDVATGAARTTQADRGPRITASGLRFSPDGQTLAVVTSDANPWLSRPPLTAVVLWDVATGTRKPGPPMPGPDRSTDGLTFNTDGRFLAIQTANLDWLWDMTADPPAPVRFDSDAADLSVPWPYLPLWTSDGTAILAADGLRGLALFDPVQRERRQTFRFGHEQVSSIQSPSFSPDGRTLLVSYQIPSWVNRLPDLVQRWLTRIGSGPGFRTVAATFDVATGRPLRLIERPANRWLLPRSFTPDGRSFWTMTLPPFPPPSPTDQVVFERWSVEAGTPWGMIGLTATGLALAATDWRRERRRWSA
jgi:WD40 repeat protein